MKEMPMPTGVLTYIMDIIDQFINSKADKAELKKTILSLKKQQ